MLTQHLVKQKHLKLTFVIVALLFLYNFTYATVTIGTTTLRYRTGNNFSEDITSHDSSQPKVNSLHYKQQQEVLSQVKKQLANLQPQINKKLNESGNFITFDAESTVDSWQQKNPKFLTQIEQQESLALESNIKPQKKKTNTASGPTVTADTGNSIKPKFILIGFIKSIKIHKDQSNIMHTNKTSILYSLDIVINYKVINYNTKKLVTNFIARGHGGIARIVTGNRKADLLFNSKMITDTAIGSLITNIKHGLEIKQIQGVLPKNKSKHKKESFIKGAFL